MACFRFCTILLASLSMAMAFSHLLQLPPRMNLDGATWITTQQLYRLYGTVGGLIEVGAVIASSLLALTLRKSPAFWPTLAGAVCLVVALATWFLLVAPVNVQISQWTTESIPGDWQNWRRQWEYSHAVRFLFLVTGLGFLIHSINREPRA